MPTRSSKTKKKKPADLNQLALSIVKEATAEPSEETPTEEKEKNPAAVALGRLGGKKGGKARAEKLSPERRKEIAQKAAESRWKNKK